MLAKNEVPTSQTTAVTAIFDPIATDGRTVRDVLSVVNARLSLMVPEAAGHSFGTGLDLTLRDRPWPDMRWIAVYAVRGGSEGHYVHIHAVGRNTDPNAMAFDNELISFEKFWEAETALAVAQAVTRMLYG